MFLDATRATVYHNTVLPSCSTHDVSDPLEVYVALKQSVHNPDSKNFMHTSYLQITSYPLNNF